MDRNSNNDEGETNMGSDKLRKKKHKIESFLRERTEKATKKKANRKNTKYQRLIYRRYTATCTINEDYRSIWMGGELRFNFKK